MFTRSILIPSLVVCALAAPFLLSPNNFNGQTVSPAAGSSQNWATNSVYPDSLATLGQPYPFSTVPGSNAYVPQRTEFAGFPNQSQPIVLQNSNHSFYQPSISQPTTSPGTSSPGNLAARIIPFGLVSRTAEAAPSTGQTIARNGELLQNHGSPVYAGPQGQPLIGPPSNIGPPDMMSAQSLAFPGYEFGPDLNAQPLEFLPVTDFGEIFRFDVSPNWVKSRWKRISTNPGEDELHGLRVALVTGVNTWDLHGSLTYYFDVRQTCQRITFRGWTGDPSRFLTLLTQRFEFKAQQSHLAGFYLAKNFWKTTGGLLMKNPPVIYTENPSQQLAIVMEMNNPSGKTKLSDDFQSLIDGSISR